MSIQMYLSDAVYTGHCLYIDLRIPNTYAFIHISAKAISMYISSDDIIVLPVAIEQYNRIRRSQVQPLTTSSCAQHE